MAPLQETTFADGVDGVLDALDADGGVIVRDFLAPDVLERLRADIKHAAEERQVGTAADNALIQWFWGEQTMRFTRMGGRSSAFIDVVSTPGFLEVADRLLLPNCQSYWLNTGQAMILGPGQPAQFMHRDAQNWPWVHRFGGPELTVSVMLAIEDFTAENGATVVAPGSHRWEDPNRYPTEDEMTQAVMPAGSGMIYTGQVVHGGGANTTEDTWRWGLHVSYLVGWLTPEEALPLGTPWEAVKDRPERIQQLFGWRCTSPGTGASRLWTVDYEDVPTGLGLT